MAIDFGRAVVLVGPRRRRWLMIDLRAILVCALAAIALVVTAVYALTTGDAQLSIEQVLRAVSGTGNAFTEMIVVQWRLPRILAAIIFGACLAASGAIFQSLTDNPLGSPDVIGFQTGAYTGAIIVMITLRGGGTLTMLGSLLGGLATALVVYLLAQKNGHARGLRLVIVGIAVSAMLASLNTYLLLTATLEDALMASLWGAGTLSGSSWRSIAPAVLAGLVLLAGSAALVRPLNLLQLGVPFAHGLGLRVARTQLLAIFIGIGLTSVVTSTAGPIAFIALAAPQIARRLVRAHGLALAPAAVVGALLLLLADTVAQRIVPTSPLPVGILTVCIGGIYFFWLLIREGRR